MGVTAEEINSITIPFLIWILGPDYLTASR